MPSFVQRMHASLLETPCYLSFTELCARQYCVLLANATKSSRSIILALHILVGLFMLALPRLRVGAIYCLGLYDLCDLQYCVLRANATKSSRSIILALHILVGLFMLALSS
jgi:hypothetical protein